MFWRAFLCGERVLRELATYGEKLKAPKTYNDVRELVVTDYQEQLEKAWIEALRKRYTVVLNKEVLSTVNKH